MLFIESISRGLIGLELSLRSSHPLGSCPNFTVSAAGLAYG